MTRPTPASWWCTSYRRWINKGLLLSWMLLGILPGDECNQWFLHCNMTHALYDSFPGRGWFMMIYGNSVVQVICCHALSCAVMYCLFVRRTQTLARPGSTTLLGLLLFLVGYTLWGWLISTSTSTSISISISMTCCLCVLWLCWPHISLVLCVAHAICIEHDMTCIWYVHDMWL